MAGQPKAPFWAVVWLVILGLVGLSAWRAGLLEPFGLRPPGNAAAGRAPVPPAGGTGARPAAAFPGGRNPNGSSSPARHAESPTSPRITSHTTAQNGAFG